MRAYKTLTFGTVLLAIATFVAAALLHYQFPCRDTDFWANVCLGVFGSSVLTAMTSVVSYHHEKRSTLKSFLYHTQQLLSYLNKYQKSMLLEQKLQFFLDYAELDKSAWDMDFENMDFFFDKLRGNRKYIYDRIYKPILDFNYAVAKHAWSFRWHLDGSGKDEVVMQIILSELQEHLLEKTEREIPTEYNERGNATVFHRCSSIRPKLVYNVRKELMGRYFGIMYGKKIAKKPPISEEGKNNG